MKHPDVVRAVRHSRVADGVAVGAGETVRYQVPVFGLLRGIVRAVAGTNGGTIAFRYVKPTSTGEYPQDGSSLHGNVPAVTALTVNTTEAARELDFNGEAYLDIAYTDSGSGTTGLDIVVSGV